MDKLQNSIEIFNEGFNCAQAVFSAFCDELGLSRDLALKLSSGFGGGMCQGEVCGAVTGAIMVIGFKYGNNKADDKESREVTNKLIKQFSDKFKMLNSSIICRELLNCDLNTEEGKEYILSNNLFTTLCAGLIGDAVSILKEYI